MSRENAGLQIALILFVMLTAGLASARTVAGQLQQEHAASQAARDRQVGVHEQAADQAEREARAAREQAREDHRRELRKDEILLQKTIEMRQAAQREAAAWRAKYTDLDQRHQKALDDVARLRRKIAVFEGDLPTPPDGKISYVSYRMKRAWIDRGRVDGLPLRTEFDVFPAGIPSTEGDARKGRVTVVKILEDHLAEGRLIDDVHREPILVGDDVYSTAWSP